jgi:hypothetical protein
MDQGSDHKVAPDPNLGVLLKLLFQLLLLLL